MTIALTRRAVTTINAALEPAHTERASRIKRARVAYFEGELPQRQAPQRKTRASNALDASVSAHLRSDSAFDFSALEMLATVAVEQAEKERRVDTVVDTVVEPPTPTIADTAEEATPPLAHERSVGVTPGPRCGEETSSETVSDHRECSADPEADVTTSEPTRDLIIIVPTTSVTVARRRSSGSLRVENATPKATSSKPQPAASWTGHSKLTELLLPMGASTV